MPRTTTIPFLDHFYGLHDRSGVIEIVNNLYIQSKQIDRVNHMILHLGTIPKWRDQEYIIVKEQFTLKQ